MITQFIKVFTLTLLTNLSMYGVQQVHTYKNPVIDSVFADPSVLQTPENQYYVYATNTIIGEKMINIPVACSSNLTQWDYLGDAMPEKPKWANKTSKFWAPHVLFDSKLKKYFMYFSSANNTGSGMCIGVATSDKPVGPFVDSGEPLICGESFINIDPMAFDDPKSGKKLLYWGSGFKPIKVQELDADRLHFAPGSTPVDVVSPGKEKKYTSLLEAPWIIFRKGYYYLFYSGDNCCGERASYAVLVSRSKNAFGPFTSLAEAEGSESSVILEQKDFWIAPGHNAIATDKAGNDWMVYHAIHPQKRYINGKSGNKIDRRILLIDKIKYKSGWPVVEGCKPTNSERPSPAVK